ncbi:ty3-gypsy retrotransposon protein [Tanacetum coccineum]
MENFGNEYSQKDKNEAKTEHGIRKSLGSNKLEFVDKALKSIYVLVLAKDFFIKTHGEAVTWAEYEEVDVNEDPMAELKNLRNVSYPAKNTSTLALPAPISQIVTKSNHVFGEIRREGEEVFDDCLEEVSSVMTEYVLPGDVQQCTPHISLNSLSGIPIHNTMRVKGHENLPFECFSGWRKQIDQSIYGKRFLMEDTRGTIQWNFKELRMKFMFQGKKIVLRGTNQSELTWMSGKSFSKKFNQQDAYVASICCMVPSATLHLMQSSVDSGIGGNMESQALLEEYADVFEEPKTLPPHRSFDHQIPLKDRDVNVNVRPYRPSHSPFSSPIVMVKKKDGSWRMCIDYRQLNKFTIKDKFQITVIEELIDELQGAQVFFKLDLRSGYHQIRMKEEDVYKTSFKSHEGHYEFVVMPFGLINAPSTFQALMNCVFNPFLRKFALVFFDDILVYNPSVTAHIAHLKMVLQVMRENTLFVKKSKYMFGTGTVEYLGHVISGMRVATDPSKIQAMQDWPIPTNIKQIRGFLGLTGYYRRFIKGYAVISQPLTALLKKNAF